MAQSHRRGKDGPKPNGKNGAKPKSAPDMANKSASVKSGGKCSSRRPESMGGLSSSNDGNSRPALQTKKLPLPLQQLLLNVFQYGLLSDRDSKTEALSRPLSELVQILKTHLYHRDFISAFADANEELLKAYALRWSAGRALGYAGIFASVLEMIIQHRTVVAGNDKAGQHVVCIGGGAGAEIVGLAAAWRWLHDGGISNAPAAVTSDRAAEFSSMNNNFRNISLENEMEPAQIPDTDTELAGQQPFSNFSITSIDIADWSSLVNTLNKAILSESIPSSMACPAPLIPPTNPESQVDGQFQVHFKKADVLKLTDQEMRSLFSPPRNVNGDMKFDWLAMKRNENMLVTLMFTLNELFLTSISMTTAFLLRLTDMLHPGTILLVVDSPGSYSTVSFATSKENSTQKSSNSSTLPPSREDHTTRQDVKASATKSNHPMSQRNYPMRFLLDHALLSVADGNWERVVSEDSRWFRRDTTLLKYQVGDGIGLEDMRVQIHVYRRLGG